ncbi:DUF1611 domain-containing protein [Saliphagus sp. LR7]|uniref:DUF1611 domain-containing protein n=1 Tax=Saliphagus sp. LR7 TaxID=2282654 RepID=UPI000DF74ACE|nr:DUF1611 domain-containing protein [Saliphagus sp. LR7]
MAPASRFGDRIAILAHGGYPDNGKTMEGVMRYGDYEIAAVLAHDHAGSRTRESFPDLPDAPIWATMDDVTEPVDALLIGVAPVGGGIDDRWRADIVRALERGCDVVSGLHDQLSEDPEFAALAAEYDATIHELREPPSELPVASGIAEEVDATVVLTVGTDCAVGKMTTTMELAAAARERGISTGVVATGQTGIAITGRGIAIDRVQADFAAGAAEQLVVEIGANHDLLVVEGQASIVHPAFAADSIALLHGARPDYLVLCHDATRESYHNFEPVPLPAADRYVEWYTSIADPISPTELLGGALDTSDIDEEAAARAAVEAYENQIGAPATDVIRYGPGPLLDALE